jgi:hypothetical protein
MTPTAPSIRSIAASACFVLACIAAQPAFAQRTTPALQIAEVSQSDNTVTVKNFAGAITSRAELASAKKTPIRIPATLDTSTRIMLLDPNPLLFTYTWKDITSEDSADYTAIVALTALLKGVAGHLETLSQQADPAAARANVETAMKALGPDPKWIASFSEALTSVATMADKTPAILQTAVQNPEQAKLDAERALAALDDSAKAIADGFQAVDRGIASMIADIAKQKGNPALAAYLALLKTAEPDARKTVELLMAFSRDAQKIGVPLIVGTVPYSSTQTQTATVVIARTKANPNKDTGLEGTYTFTITPHSRVDISIAPAYIYSWVKGAPEASGQTLAAMVTVAHRPETSRMLVFGLSLGLSPRSKGLDFYVGPSVRVADRFQLGGGFSWTDTKDDGKAYKPGGYLLLSVDLFPKK